MDSLLTQANDLIAKVWPAVVAVVGAGLAIRLFKSSLRKQFKIHSGALVAPFIKAGYYEKENINYFRYSYFFFFTC